MQFPAKQIAQLLNGKVEGNEDALVNSFGKIEEATNGQISFLANPKYEEFLYTSKASIIILNKNFELKESIKPTLIRVDDAYTAFATLLDFYQQTKQQELIGIEANCHIDKTAVISDQVFIADFVYISKKVKVGKNTKLYPHVFLGENVVIGDNVIIHSGVKIYHDCTIGNNTIIHGGTIIGSDGFGFAPQADGTFKKVPQIGNVIIENDVEIGANVTIDRATIGSTIIRQGAKLDNLIQIAHNVEIGSKSVIAAFVGISGSSKIGNNVMIGGQTGITGHITIADGTKINGKSGITKSVKIPNTSLAGYPANDFKTEMKRNVILKRLPELEKRVEELEKLLLQKKNKV